MTRFPTTIAATALAMALSPAALAANDTAINGTYLLRQVDDRQRLIVLEPSGTVTQISDQQSALGFTPGLGSWTRTGPHTARASVVDFNQPGENSDDHGASMIVYDLTFSDPVDGKYQTVTGNYSGQAFDAGQNPLSSHEPHVRSFGTRFEGTRILAQ